MRLLRDFKCDDGHITERFIDSGIESVLCGCGKEAKRMLSCGTVMLDGTDPGFPGAWNKWADIREKRHRDSQRK